MIFIVKIKVIWVDVIITAAVIMKYKLINNEIYLTWHILQNVSVCHLFVRTLNDILLVLIVDSVTLNVLVNNYVLSVLKTNCIYCMNAAVSCFHCISQQHGCIGVSDIMACPFILNIPYRMYCCGTKSWYWMIIPWYFDTTVFTWDYLWINRSDTDRNKMNESTY